MDSKSRSIARRACLVLMVAMLSAGLSGCCSMSSSMAELKGFIAALSMMRGLPPQAPAAPGTDPNAPASTPPSAPAAPTPTPVASTPPAPTPTPTKAAFAVDENGALGLAR